MLGILNLKFDFATGEDILVFTTAKSKKALWRRINRIFKNNAKDWTYRLDQDYNNFKYSFKKIQMIHVSEEALKKLKLLYEE